MDRFSSVISPYGTFEVIYDDGYTFDCGEGGFDVTLDVLGEAVKVVGCCELPAQVFENDDKPLSIKVILPTSNGDTEDFMISIR